MDAYLKGIHHDINWEDGYGAVQKDAEVEPYDWSNEGRGGLDSWRKLHYIPVQDFDYIGFGTMTRSISRTLEYAYNDYVIAQMARKMGRHADAEKYESASTYWQNLFKKDQTSYINGSNTGFTGFFQPKFLNGTWGYQVRRRPSILALANNQDPNECSNIDTSGEACSLQNTGAETFESSIWEYQLYLSPQALTKAQLMHPVSSPTTWLA